MRCAHCGHETGDRNWFQFRADSGLRCVSCRKVFYADPSAARPVTRLLILLALAGFVAGLILLNVTLSEVVGPWILVVYTVGYMPVFMAVSHIASAGAPTLSNLPDKERWRRRCMRYGSGLFTISQILRLALRDYFPTDDWSFVISIGGSAIMLLFFVASFAHPPRAFSDPQSN